MDISKAFGIILQKLRKENGLTREHLAELAEIEYTYVYLLENGRRQPTLTTIFLLARALKISPTMLIAAVEDAKPMFSGRGEKPPQLPNPPVVAERRKIKKSVVKSTPPFEK